MRQFQAWGYKIDYDKEIAKDEAEIAALTEPGYVFLIQSLTEEELGYVAQGYDIKWYMLLGTSDLHVARRQALGITELEAICVSLTQCIHSEWRPGVYGYDLVGETPDPPQYWLIGESVMERLGGIWIRTEAQRLHALKKAKASLARHRRNKAKYGT